MPAAEPPHVRSPEIDAFLAAMPEPARAALEELRSTIAAAAPEAVETISYGVPAFKYRKRAFVSFGAGKGGSGHLAFYVQSPRVLEQFVDEVASFSTSTGTIRFSPERPIPADLVRRIVEARMREIDERS